MNKIIPSVIEDNGEYYIHIEEYKTLKELLEHYEHLYNEVKKQKDDVVEYVKNNINYYYDEDLEEGIYQDEISGNELLRMLGEKDVKD